MINRLLLTSLTILLAACSDDLLLSEEIPVSERTSTLIGPTGGDATSADDKLTLSFPAGALRSETIITIEPSRDYSHPTLVSRAYELGPDGTTFDARVLIAFDVGSSTGRLAVANLDAAEPEILPSSRHDGVRGRVTAELEHFSSYGVVSVYDPCENAACGDTCTLCPPSGPSLPSWCTEPPGNRACNADGMCVLDSPNLCALPIAQLSVSPAVLDFGQVEVGRSASRSVTVSNTGNGTGTLDALTISPTFTASASLPISIAVGAQVSLDVAFSPTSAVASTGTLELQAGATTLTVTLTGEGTSVSTSITETFSQFGAPRGDVLVVVDNSCSMTDEQAALGQNAGVIFTALSAALIDFHIGIITTDVDTAPAAAGALVGSPTFITPNTPSAPRAFASNVDVGAGGGPFERGFAAAEAALTPPNTTGMNAGFLRDEAWLTVVYISDEEDQSTVDPADHLTNLQALKGPNRASHVRVNAVTGGPNGCGGAAGASPRYEQVVMATGGNSESICAPSWVSALTNLGGAGFGLQTTFTLTQDPAIQSPIAVTVNGSNVPAAGNWSFDAATRTVVFEDGSVPPAGSTIDVAYTP